jgi:two-component system, LytTR family, sensor kinase
MQMRIARLRSIAASAALRPVLVIWGFGYLLVDIFVYLMGRMPLGVSSIASIPLFVLGVTYTLLLERLQRSVRRRRGLVRWGLLGGALMLATAVHAFFDLYYFKWLASSVVPDWQRWALDVTPERIFTVGLLYLWTFCLALTLLWAAGVGNEAERSASRAQLLEAEKQRAEAAALRLQLNPHFLFNTLNSISSLVVLDRKTEAEEMIDRLSEFLRASLEADPTADVPLSQELDMIDAYLAIETARFGDRLEVSIEVADTASSALVPNFILQPLVENAVKHGVATCRGKATLAITARVIGPELILSVLNSSSSDQPDLAVKGAGIGLANTRQRLSIRYGGAASLMTQPTPTGFLAEVCLPWRVPPAQERAPLELTA